MPGRIGARDLAHEINGANPPDIEASSRTAEEIEAWFEENPSAPLILTADLHDGCIPD